MSTIHTHNAKYAFFKSIIKTTNGSMVYSTCEINTSFTQSAVWFPNNTPFLGIVSAGNNNVITNIWDLVKNN